MEMLWFGSPALNERVGIFSLVNPSRNLPKGSVSVWLEQVGGDLLVCPSHGGEGQEQNRKRDRKVISGKRETQS